MQFIVRMSNEKLDWQECMVIHALNAVAALMQVECLGYNLCDVDSVTKHVVARTPVQEAFASHI